MFVSSMRELDQSLLHRLRAFADSSPTPFADVSFNIFNIGVEYLSGVGSPSLSDFPATASSTEATWSEPHQGVAITGYGPRLDTAADKGQL